MSTDVPGALGGLVPEIRRVVRRIARRDADVEDIVQECCLRILRKERLWNPGRGALKSWIGTLVRNLTISFVVARRREKAPGPPEPPAPPPDAHTLEWIRDEFRSLPEAQKEALLLVYYHGLGTTEAAKALGITRPAVADRIARALESLRGRARATGFFPAAIPWTFATKTGLEVSLMSVKQKVVMTAVACLFVGGAATRIALDAARPDSPVEVAEAASLTAENRLLKRQLAQAAEERRALAESARPVPTPAPHPSTAETAVASASEGRSETAASEAALRAHLQEAGDVADLLGLEPARRKYFEDIYEDALRQVQDEERKRARVTKGEGKGEIRIPAFPEEGRVLAERWAARLSGALTPPERERYDRLQLDRILFPRGMGSWDRVTEYELAEPPYSTTFREKWADPGEEPVHRSTWAGPAADRCYRHLVELPSR